MNPQEFSKRVDEVKRIYGKILRGEKLTPEEEEISNEEWPPEKRCRCCGKILILM
jgi:hypothetical protein